MADSMHEVVWTWLMGCEYIGDMFFNASRAEDGGTQLIPSEQTVTEYIDGSEKLKYICTLTRFLPYSADPNDTANLEIQIDFEKLGDWIEKKLRLNELPDAPESCAIQDIRVLPNESGLMVAQDYSRAKYQLQFEIEYIREPRFPVCE